MNDKRRDDELREYCDFQAGAGFNNNSLKMKRLKISLQLLHGNFKLKLT